MAHWSWRSPDLERQHLHPLAASLISTQRSLQRNKNPVCSLHYIPYVALPLEGSSQVKWNKPRDATNRSHGRCIIQHSLEVQSPICHTKYLYYVHMWLTFLFVTMRWSSPLKSRALESARRGSNYLIETLGYIFHLLRLYFLIQGIRKDRKSVV